MDGVLLQEIPSSSSTPKQVKPSCTASLSSSHRTTWRSLRDRWSSTWTFGYWSWPTEFLFSCHLKNFQEISVFRYYFLLKMFLVWCPHQEKKNKKQKPADIVQSNGNVTSIINFFPVVFCFVSQNLERTWGKEDEFWFSNMFLRKNSFSLHL